MTRVVLFLFAALSISTAQEKGGQKKERSRGHRKTKSISYEPSHSIFRCTDTNREDVLRFDVRLHVSSAYVSIRQRTSYVSIQKEMCCVLMSSCTCRIAICFS